MGHDVCAWTVRLAGLLSLVLLAACSPASNPPPPAPTVNSATAVALARLTVSAAQPPVTTTFTPVPPTAAPTQPSSPTAPPTAAPTTAAPPTTTATTAPPTATSTAIPPTARPTLRPTQAPRPPTPTPLVLATDPIPGQLDARILYLSLATNGIYIEVEAREQKPNARNGQGVAKVVFEIRNQAGQRVHTQTETNPRFCAFGGDDNCFWPIPATNARWPSTGLPIQNGEYTVKATVFDAANNSQDSNTVTFRIQRR